MAPTTLLATPGAPAHSSATRVARLAAAIPRGWLQAAAGTPGARTVWDAGSLAIGCLAGGGGVERRNSPTLGISSTPLCRRGFFKSIEAASAYSKSGQKA